MRRNLFAHFLEGSKKLQVILKHIKTGLHKNSKQKIRVSEKRHQKTDEQKRPNSFAMKHNCIHFIGALSVFCCLQKDELDLRAKMLKKERINKRKGKQTSERKNR